MDLGSEIEIDVRDMYKGKSQEKKKKKEKKEFQTQSTLTALVELVDFLHRRTIAVRGTRTAAVFIIWTTIARVCIISLRNNRTR